MTAAAPEQVSPTVIRLRVALLGTKPSPWRRVEVLATTTLGGLHGVIQAAMGRADLHLHRFRVLGRQCDSEHADLTRVRLAGLRLRAGERFSYTDNLRPAACEQGAAPAWHIHCGGGAMAIRFTLTLAVEGGTEAGEVVTRAIAAIERDALAPETLGLTLAEGKAILAELQAAVVAEQAAAHEAAVRRCAACRSVRRMKGHRPLTCRTAFGTARIKAARLRRCGCGGDTVAGECASFSPLADLLPERTLPELLYLETRWGSLVSFRLAAAMLGDVLPLDRPVAPERVRRHLHAIAVGEEAALGEAVEGWAWSGCQRDLDEMPPPDGPACVRVDGGFVRDRAGSWFEVIAGKSVPGFRRNAAENEEPRPAKCFAFVQAYDDRPRLLDVLAAQGYAPNQKLVHMSDGGETVRRLVARIGPETEHVFDWWHVTMRLTVLMQMVKGACPADPGWTEERLRDLERLKWLLWHGHARHAADAAQDFADDAWGLEEGAAGEAKPARLRAAAEEFATYLRRNAGQIINYGERHRAGERISTGFVESAVNQVVSKRFGKRQSMRWTQAGAHLTLQARTRVLNGELEDAFRRRWPGFRPPPRTDAVDENHTVGFIMPGRLAPVLRYTPVAGRQPDPLVITVIPPRTAAVPSTAAGATPQSARPAHRADPRAGAHGRSSRRFRARSAWNGCGGWQRAVGYGRSSLGETAVFRYKALIRPGLRARGLPAQKTEARAGCAVLNGMTRLGMPVSRRIA